MRAECDGCTVVAGDVLDQPGMTRYLAAYRRGLDGSPTIWGLHNYADANRFRKSGLSALLKAVPGEIWLTETGGIVAFGRAFPRNERRAARALQYAFDLAVKTPRVRRIYLYNWTGGKPGDRFDAGIVGPDGKPRPAYGSCARRWRAERARARVRSRRPRRLESAVSEHEQEPVEPDPDLSPDEPLAPPAEFGEAEEVAQEQEWEEDAAEGGA